ncbi:MAG: CvpA family protein [Faecalibacterium sp.]|jgi:uncharacterized membrane protein required for colicin V production|nr:CvpA family protein [Faecalibacterium sp.]
MEVSTVFTNPSFIFDMLCIAALLILALLYAKKGLVATLMQCFGTLASLIGAKFLADWASPVIFENFLAQGFVSRISGTITDGGAVNVAEIVQKYAGFLPQQFVDSVVESVQGTVDGALSSNAATIAETVVTQVIEPLFTPVIAIVLFFVAFAVFRMLVSLLVTALTNVNKIPVVGGVNRWLGFCVGLVAGCVDLFLILCALWAIMVITGGGLPYLNEAALETSFFYKAFNAINPFM